MGSIHNSFRRLKGISLIGKGGAALTPGMSETTVKVAIHRLRPPFLHLIAVAGRG